MSDKDLVILAVTAEEGKTYFSRGGREVVCVAKTAQFVRMKVLLTGNIVPVPLDYPLVVPKEAEESVIETSAVELVVPKEVEETEEIKLMIPVDVVEPVLTVELPINPPTLDLPKEEKFLENITTLNNDKIPLTSSNEIIAPHEEFEEKKKPGPSPRNVVNIKTAIRQLLETGKEYTVEEIGALTNAATTTVRLKLSELRKDGIPLAHKDKKYRLGS